MGIIKDVTIVNETRLRINVNASAGDEIDLTLLNEVNTSIILDKINQAKDEEYNKKLKEFEKRAKAENENAILKATNELCEQITRLKEENKNIEKQTESKLNLMYLEKLKNLENELDRQKGKLDALKENNKKELELAIINKEQELKSKIINLEASLKEKEQEVKNIKLISEKDLEIALSEKEKELSEIITCQKEEISNLKLFKSSLNVKKLGEELEGWCNNEYNHYALNGFETCIWYKDNLVIKDDDELRGSKADYILKVFATKERKEEDLLTSVVLEMKSESPNSKTRRKNSDFYEKLDKDRIKKKAEYALLISELEWDQDNDVPIRKVQEYDKMYLVRPQYFINFLGIIASLALKYKEVLIESNKEALKFKDSKQILDEFEMMKDDILNKQMSKLSKEIEFIASKADDIIKLSTAIKESTEKITIRFLDNIINIIEKFNIKKINRKIEKLEDELTFVK